MTSDEIEKRMAPASEKICFICEKAPALFQVKNRPLDCYCEECAVEYFGSIDYLEQIQ